MVQLNVLGNWLEFSAIMTYSLTKLGKVDAFYIVVLTFQWDHHVHIYTSDIQSAKSSIHSTQG